MNTQSVSANDKFANLQELADKRWDSLLTHSPAIKAIYKGEIDIRFYAIYMIETYHYTHHNAANQALVGARSDNNNVQYSRFCYEHAMEETGHDLMAFHDLKSLGVNVPIEDLPTPLPATEVLIAYLYRVSETGNPLRRLGYSFWSENSYQHFMPILNEIKNRFKLENKNLTFFIQHAEIDDGHAEDIEKQILRHAINEADWKAIAEVMDTSLSLAWSMFESSFDAFCALRDGQSDKFEFLNSLLESETP